MGSQPMKMQDFRAKSPLFIWSGRMGDFNQRFNLNREELNEMSGTFNFDLYRKGNKLILLSILFLINQSTVNNSPLNEHAFRLFFHVG